jgi:hypothetical protein
MFRNHILTKTLAVFFILEIALNIAAPTISYALTAGPTAPEATSFEPVDTTDMVNTITGDFVYNMPLLEVPGPGGSYPLSLSYHAGIQPNVEASWVGLGWTLNPGSINRITNGLADDFSGVQSFDRSFWEGGETTVTTVGVSVGIGDYATVSAGLSFANDTYKGRGIGGYVGASLQFLDKDLGSSNSGMGLNASASVRVGISPYGGAYVSAGVGLGIGKTQDNIRIGANLGLSVNSRSGFGAGLSGGISAVDGKQTKHRGKQGSSASILDASIGTGGSKGSLGVAGVSASVNNTKEGKVSSTSDSWSIDIPVWYGVNVNIGRDYVRYWSDETESLSNYGSLYFPSGDVGDMSTKVFDSYHIQGLKSLATGDNAAKHLDGSFADYDHYSVNAQGLGGNIRPYHFNVSLYSQDIVNTANETKDVLGYFIPQPSQKVIYRFVNDFSNRVLNEPNDILVNYAHPYTPPGPFDVINWTQWRDQSDSAYSTPDPVPLYFQYSNPTTGKFGEAPRYIPYVPGSKHIEYFSNDEIIQHNQFNQQTGQYVNPQIRADLKARGFIDCQAKGFVRTGVGGKVGSYSITNESGVTYHFSLPAYSYNEMTYTEGKPDSEGSRSFNNSSQPIRYAYTWYLTGITGPDFVDRGPNGEEDGDGILNEQDWGYWVDFQYGLWSNDYDWRNPGEDFNTDLDNNFKSFSTGKKELYYLNAIKTQSHTALFVKKMRADGKGTTSEYNGTVVTNANSTISWVDNGGYLPAARQWIIYNEFDEAETFNTYDLPRAVMGLTSILLFDNDSLGSQNFETLSNHYMDTITYSTLSGYYSESFRPHNGDNVLDVGDAAMPSFPMANAVRVINFEHDYSLSPLTANSFDEAGVMYTGSFSYLPDKLGKLTLKSLQFKGKGGVESLPATKFIYDIPPATLDFAAINSINTETKTLELTGSGVYEIGDIIKFDQNEQTFYGYVKSKNTSIALVKVISETLPAVGSVIHVSKTKNPPFYKDFVDIWGNYKVDHAKLDERNLEKYPSEISVKNSDVWSLREIRTPMGSTIKVQYDPDTYSKSVFTENLVLSLKWSSNTTNVTPIFESMEYSHHTKVFVEASLDEETTIELNKIFEVGEGVNLVGVSYGRRWTNEGQPPQYDQSIIYGGTVQEVSSKYVRVRLYVPYIESIQFYGGYLKLANQPKYLGGGLRVSSLGITDPNQGYSRYTDYTYEFDGASSGVTSYEPINISDVKLTQVADPNINEEYRTNFFRPFYEVMSFARDIPAPGVYYGKVRISERIIYRDGSVSNIPGFSEYEFETYDRGFVGVDKVGENTVFSSGTHRNEQYNGISTAKLFVRDFSQRLGNLKSITLFDADGNKLNETINNYLHDQQTGNQGYWENVNQYPDLVANNFGSQGVIHETFNHARWVKKTANDKKLLGIISQKEVYPSIQTGTTSINYKSGITTHSSTLAFDFYSGAIAQSLSTDGFGNAYLTESRPAYKVYPAMGLKMDAASNLNMLTQSAATYSYKVSPGNVSLKLGLMSASAQEWSNQVGVLQIPTGKQLQVWRKSDSHAWIGDDIDLQSDGFYPIQNFEEFDFGSNATNSPQWQQNSSITLYDVNSHALEAQDLNGLFAATKMSSDNTVVFATVANAKYNQFAFSGAEDVADNNVFGGGVAREDGTVVTRTNELDKLTTHTGIKALSATINQSAFSYTVNDLAGKDHFIASVWTNSLNGRLKYAINGVESGEVLPTVTKKAGDWYQLQVVIPVSGATSLKVWGAAVGGSANFDDFRVHPHDAAMTSYVYNEWGELSHILDNNNLYTKYIYDGMGRLKEVYRESFQYGLTKTSETDYHYSNQN